jgi:hypothetical protein
MQCGGGGVGGGGVPNCLFTTQHRQPWRRRLGSLVSPRHFIGQLDKIKDTNVARPVFLEKYQEDN